MLQTINPGFDRIQRVCGSKVAGHRDPLVHKPNDGLFRAAALPYLRQMRGWFYRSTMLDDLSRYIQGWKVCTTTIAADVTETLRLALNAAGLDQATVQQRPRPLSEQRPVLAVGPVRRLTRRARHEPYAR
jgi:transposase InsO family protein